LSTVSEEYAILRARYDRERTLIDELKEAKRQEQELKQKLKVMEVRHEVDAAAELRFETIPKVKTRIRWWAAGLVSQSPSSPRASERDC
jgi:hypothetical protein